VWKRVVPALAVLLWIGVPGAGRGAEPIGGPPTGEGRPLPEAVRAPCGTIAAILSVYPTFEVGKSSGPVRVARDGPGSAGCRVRAAGPAWGLSGEVPPERALRDLMGQLGWEEDPHRAADGPGTTSFALRKGRVLCLVRGGAPSGVDEGGKISRAATYELGAACAAEPDR